MLPAARQSIPSRVACAVVLLAVAWLASATALAINHLVFLGSGVGPGPSLGIIGLAVQAAMIALVARGAPLGRTLVVVFFALAALPLAMVARLVAEGSVVSAGQMVAGFALKGIAALLLFTGESRRWFGAKKP